ncbi:hypothetical protein GQ53DRAFT_372636 [Thozetella sp. PMI_491]|nr:hypothetical protein GQ53DRAFT_372636 [Thozetella sp. PMI_491]
MATALGPDMMVRTPTTETFNGSGLRDPIDDMAPQVSPLPSPQASPHALPLPNPPFVFPNRPSSSSAPSSYSRATGRRPRSVVDAQLPADEIPAAEPPHPRLHTLPAFSFNPGAALAPPSPMETAFLSPPQSPASPLSPKTIPPRPSNHGHRRGGSEFVGGSIRTGDSITVMSTSPTKSESGMASPTLAPANPSRRHAHRRSAAISSHDLASIILPSPNSTALRGSSAPNSPGPADQLNKNFSFPALNDNPSKSEPSLPTTPSSEPQTAREVMASSIELQPAPKHATRTRVGFSDTLEFIPRPLSLVSSDTSSTMTARPGHSVSGSISSIISASNTERDASPSLGPSPTRKSNASRPSTAGAILERTQSIHDVEPDLPSPRRRGSIPHLGAMPPQDLESSKPVSLSPTKTPKRWSFFGLEPFVAGSPTRSRPVSASSSESQTKPAVLATSPPEQVAPDSTKDDVDAASCKPASRKRSKKQKKVKTWAGSILSRKTKVRHGKQKSRAPTPPVVTGEDAQDEVTEEATSDAAPEPEPVMPTVLVTEEDLSDGNEQSWKPPRPASVPDEDTSYQMIDLDAALGPFATPLPRNLEWEAAQRAGGFAKKQLHSAAGLRGFSGPGMHYHRRAESAPEMVPFEAGRFGIHRFGSSSTMADVFEEDEEDDDSADKSTGQSTPLAETPAVDKSDSSSMGDASENTDQLSVHSTGIAVQAGIKRKGSDLSEGEKPQLGSRLRSEPSAATFHDEVITEEASGSKMAPLEDPAAVVDASGSAAPSPRPSIRTKDLAPVDVNPLHLPAASLAPISPYSMTQSSAFPSPRSPMSYDAHRISTAPSSITEDNFQSLLMGEPGPEVRISVDIDIPSLTSSNSTMTRESIFAHNPQARYPPLDHQQRPASFTSTAFGRRRSSLASLSRLISTSHGERSKLSMEVPLDSEPEKKAKASKTKRLSRMMQFWKPKEKASS